MILNQLHRVVAQDDQDDQNEGVLRERECVGESGEVGLAIKEEEERESGTERSQARQIPDMLEIGRMAFGDD